MFEKTLMVLLTLGLPTIAFSQSPTSHPQQGGVVSPPGQSTDVDATQQETEAKLRQLIESRESLTQEIQRLEKLTGTYEQVVVSVQVCELSLGKAREIELPQGFDSAAIREHGFRAILSSPAIDPHKHSVVAPANDVADEAVVTRVLEDGEALNDIIDAFANAGTLKSLAKPSVVTVSGRHASVHIGGEFPVRVIDAQGNSAIQFKAYGTQLEVLPQVLGQQRLRLDVRPTVSEIDSRFTIKQGGEKVPGLRVRGVSTHVEMSSGQTLVIAGLVQHRPIHTSHPGPDADATTDTGATTETEAVELIVLFRPEIVDSL